MVLSPGAGRASAAGGSAPIEFSTAAGQTSAAGVQPRGCKGRSPLHKITLSLPLPAGKSALRARSGGWGQKRKLKAGAAGDKESKPPAGCRQRPPNRQRRGTPPSGYQQRLGKQVPPGFKPRGCKGRSPLHKITLSLPLPAGKSALRARSGGWGQKRKLKAGAAGDKESKPPAGCRQRPPNRQRRGTPPSGYQQRLGKQVPPGFKPRGCKGRSPLHKITLSLPLPAGKGVGGISFPFGEGGQKIKLKAG